MSVQIPANRSNFAHLNDFFGSSAHTPTIPVPPKEAFTHPFYYSEAPASATFKQSKGASQFGKFNFNPPPLRTTFSRTDQILISLLINAMLKEKFPPHSAQTQSPRTRYPSSAPTPGFVRPQFRNTFAGHFYNTAPRQNPFETNYFKPQANYAYYQPQSEFNNFKPSSRPNYAQQQHEPKARPQHHEKKPSASNGAEQAGARPNYSSQPSTEQQELNAAFSALGLTANASQDEVKKSYRKLALQFHPDRVTGDKKEATKRFQEISDAYSKLQEHFQE